MCLTVLCLKLAWYTMCDNFQNVSHDFHPLRPAYSMRRSGNSCPWIMGLFLSVWHPSLLSFFFFVSFLFRVLGGFFYPSSSFLFFCCFFLAFCFFLWGFGGIFFLVWGLAGYFTRSRRFLEFEVAINGCPSVLFKGSVAE